MANINDSFPSNYLKALDLKGRAILVQIDRVEFEAVGQQKEMKPIVYFTGKDKGLVLNKTNASKIVSLTGSENTDDWSGSSITIYPTETSFQGDMVDCIRVKAAAIPRPARPVPTPAPEPVVVTDEDIPF